MKSDQQSTPKSSSTIFSSLTDSFDSRDILINDLNEMGFTINSDTDEIWESLNRRCHVIFGYEEIHVSASPSDLKWAKKTLPFYAMWEKFCQYKPLVETWINKVNAVLKKKGKDFK